MKHEAWSDQRERLPVLVAALFAARRNAPSSRQELKAIATVEVVVFLCRTRGGNEPCRVHLPVPHACRACARERTGRKLASHGRFFLFVFQRGRATMNRWRRTQRAWP